MRKNYSFAFDILKSSEQELSKLPAANFDDLLGKYLTLLLASSLLSGISTCIIGLGRAAYFDVFMNASIDYLGVLNYSFGRGVSMFFLFLFSGTMLLFLLSVVLKTVYRKIEFILMVKILIYSMMPMIVFGWIPIFGMSMILWSLLLFFTAAKNYRR